ncbi:MAG TPA: non-canonical purine NTP pyrophosphatase, RdgB/HAM1 family [Clostridiales bacterium]|nr:non-canonical purine NTP pyrophosphatase, RdgB/HAM1 family [Clostridiales bacterium]HBR08206.1 non-canonical purine NTP pyrophosphatase, RdgB/HAM1 family [Clostridiales bacterium]
MTLILASNNENKLREFGEILAGSGITLISQREAGCDFEVEETGETFEENAFLKAEAIMRATGMPAVADDSGLEVDALGGEPGVRSARYTGSHDDTDLNRRLFLLSRLRAETNRQGRFVSAICCVFPNGDVLRARGACEGTIAREMRGENGFGYDALFVPEGCAKTMAELTPEEKNAISHRGRALREFAEELRNYHAHK